MRLLSPIEIRYGGEPDLSEIHLHTSITRHRRGRRHRARISQTSRGRERLYIGKSAESCKFFVEQIFDGAVDLDVSW